MKSDIKSIAEGEVQSQRSITILPAQELKMSKNKNLNKSDLGINFIAPNGGWGWLVVIAAAISIWVTFDVMDQFGNLFVGRLKSTGFRSSEINKIKYIQQIAASCTGLLNGEIFRRFTFRQISLTGAILTFLGHGLSAFYGDLLALSLMCGIGGSLIFSASYIAVCSYFKKNIQSAITCMCTISDLGSIFLPYLNTFLMSAYGITGAILLKAGLSLHNFPCALIYQPVKWHSGKKRDIELIEIQPLNLVFGSRHIAKLSALEENSISSTNDLSNLHYLSNTKTAYPLRVPKNSFASFEPLSRSIPKIILPDETEYLESPQDIQQESSNAIEIKKLTILQRISVFLDLDLLKNFTFVNIVLGLTLIYFVEINYDLIMIPSILNYFDCNKSQKTIALSVLTVCDFLMRISIPLVTRNFKCSNKVILLFGLIGMSIVRTILVFSNNFTVLLICFGWMGLCTAIRTIFWMLILPTYMPLNRLPAALGFQQAATGLFVLSVGQLTDITLDPSRYTHLLWINGIYLFVLLAWLGEVFLKRKTNRMIPPIK